MPSNGCTQPQCPLRTRWAESRSRLMAELIVGALAGEDVRHALAPDYRIERRPGCLDCVAQAMAGGSPLKTVEELTRLDAAGHWSHRLRRRPEHRESW